MYSSNIRSPGLIALSLQKTGPMIVAFLVAISSAIVSGQQAGPGNGYGNIVAGDHVAIVGNTFADLMHLHGYFETTLRHRFHDRELYVRNLGWAGDTVDNRARPANFADEDEWLARFKTDVILVCFGMGESFGGESGLTDFDEGLRQLLEHYRQQKYNGTTSPRLILVSPIAHEDHGNSGVSVSQRNRDLKSYAEVMRDVARDFNIEFVDLYGSTKSLLDEGGGSSLTTNGMHLTPYGYWVVSQLVVERIAGVSEPLQLDVDLSDGETQVENGSIFRLTRDTEGWSWNVAAQNWPAPSPPQEARVHKSLERFLDHVVIQGLLPGQYTLDLGSGLSLKATAAEWSRGMPLVTSQRHKEMESYRQAVNSKNLLHFHGWRALNQVHIVGERKKSPSGQALPGELVEWMRLASEADEQLSDVASPSQNEAWRLSAAK